MNKEIWVAIPDYDSIYEVSNLGNVRSYHNNHFGLAKEPKELKGLVGIYKTVVLCKNDKKHTVNVHRLVAESFIPNPMNYPVVNHINGNKLDNRADNLEWTTYKGNMQHALNSGLLGKCKKVICVETGEIYSSVTNFAKALGKKESWGSMTLKKGTYKGKTYKYLEVEK